MNRDEFIDKVMEFDEELEIYVETNSDNYMIYQNEEEYYMCSWLGNITYNSLESLANDLFDKIEKFQETILNVNNE